MTTVGVSSIDMEHGGFLSMPDLNFILIFDQNDVFDHFLILKSIFVSYFCYLLRNITS